MGDRGDGDTYVLTGSALGAGSGLEKRADWRFEDSPLLSLSLARERNLLNPFLSFSSLGADDAGFPEGFEVMMMIAAATIWICFVVTIRVSIRNREPAMSSERQAMTSVGYPRATTT